MTDEFDNWDQFHAQILELERDGLVTRTFRRLDPERQEAIVNAILEESAEKGPASLNIKLVAERAGASIGSLYQYFTSREGLMRFVIRFASRTMAVLFKLSMPFLRQMSLREALTSYLTVGVEWGQMQIGLSRFIARAAYQGDPELRASVVLPVADMMRETVQEILAQAQARGELRSGIDLDATTRAVNALLIALVDSQLLPYLNHYFQVTAPEMPLERVSVAAVDMILSGILRPTDQKDA
jgi:AcrR family transcriptional regulator